MSTRQRQGRNRRFGNKRRLRPLLENLEPRLVLSVNPHVQLNLMEFHDPSRIPPGVTPSPLGILPLDGGTSFPVGYTPDQLATAYGIGNIKFGSVTGDGTGQTIAIVDAYDDPSFVNEYLPPPMPGGAPVLNPNFATSDLGQFDSQLGIADPPNFTKVNESGQTSPLPGTDPAGAGSVNGNWEIEEALDIEWAHAIAPGANIVLVEATTDSNNNLFSSITAAANLAGVSAVSMSWGLDESSLTPSEEMSLDGTFVTPQGHQGVTFVAASGDSGAYLPDVTPQTVGVLYPAVSPNVVGVGGTTLNLNSDDTYNSETAWSLSGGGTSTVEPRPAFQDGAQNTAFRTVPDVAFNADQYTGVAVYDSYNDVDNSGPWVDVGGTSLGAPSWAALIAIANQGRVLAGATTLDGPGQTLPALYAVSPTDFNDITSGSNGVFTAGPGYDEVTGLGSPKADRLVPDLATYGTASQLGVTAQPPSNVIAGDSFGVVVAAENPAGDVDPAFNGTVTISLGAIPGGGMLGGTLTATAYHGVAVFDGLTLDSLGTGYTLQIMSSKFPTITTSAFNVTSNPTPWQGTFYPVPTDTSLRAAISAADSNSYAYNTILLESSTYLLSDAAAGELLINNSSSLPGKTLTIAGQGAANSIVGSGYEWTDRIFEITGSNLSSVSVVFQNLTIEGGNAENSGAVGGTAALGGGLLIEDAAVTLQDVVVQNNLAHGYHGSTGAAGQTGAAGATGGDGRNAKGGAIYLASGSLLLFGDTISNNGAVGGQGGLGGKGGGQGSKSAAGVTGGQGGVGGNGGSAAGGGIYAAGGMVVLANDTLSSNQAVGGPGGQGGSGGSGGRGEPTKSPPVAGKPGGHGGMGGVGGSAHGGAIYLAAGSLSVTASTVQTNSAIGGAGGQGGSGGPGTAAVGGSTQILGGSGSFPGLTNLPANAVAGGPGGSGGPGGNGGPASGGGVFVGGGMLTIGSSTLVGNQAVGGAGGLAGRGGTAGFTRSTSILGIRLPIGGEAGHGGTGGTGGSGYGGGISVQGGAVVLLADTLNGNVAQGGHGGTGGMGGSGPLALLFGGSGITTGGGGTPPTTPTLGGGGGVNSAGPGGDGGNGANGNGGGLYVSGGTLTLTNDTIAADLAEAGSSGSGGKGGHAGTGKLTGGPGGAGAPGSFFAGGLYVNGGTVNLFNSTVALNIHQDGTSAGGGVVQSAGTVTAVSTLFGGNNPVGTNPPIDYSGDVTATDSLFQTAPTGVLSGSGNIETDPMLDSNGLKNNGGPTETIALQSTSPAIDAGTNPEGLLADQRGYTPRTGPNGTDIGAYQHDAQLDSQAPTATLQADDVTSSNAASLNPYVFTITFSDSVAIEATSLSGAVVEVVPPGQTAPVPATVVSTQSSGATDSLGDAQSFVVTYQITPPGGAWTSTDDGTYTVTLGGAPVIDVAGNAVPSGPVGTFSVSLNKNVASVQVSSSLPNSTYGQSVSFTVTVSGGGPTPGGTVQFVVDGSDLGGLITLSGGTGTSPSTTLLGAGSHTVVAQYSGDPNYSANTGSYTQDVNQASLTLVADNQSMNHYDTVPSLTYHYTGFVNGDTATSSGISASVSLNTAATSNSPAGYYPIHPTVSSFTSPNYILGGTQDGTMTVKPKVMNVEVDFGSKSMSLIGLNRDLPFINITAVDVIFSDNVNVSSSMLQLLGVNVAKYSLSGFSYNSSTFDATWTLPTAIGVDRLMLSLNGEAAPPVTGTGPNIAADPFSDNFAVLPGDVNGDGVVSASDMVVVRNDVLLGTYSIWADLDGSGTVNLRDLLSVRNRLGTRLP